MRTFVSGGGVTEKQEQSSSLPVTNRRTRRVSVDRDTEITLILTIARSLLESSTKDLTPPALEIMFRRTCPLVNGAAIVWC